MTKRFESSVWRVWEGGEVGAQCLYGLMWDGWRGFMVGGGGGGRGGEVDWESKTATQINREDVNWQASMRREQGLVNERVCLRERVCESVAECPNIFSPHSVNLFAGLLLWPRFLLSGGGWGGSGDCLTNQQHTQFTIRPSCRERATTWQQREDFWKK